LSETPQAACQQLTDKVASVHLATVDLDGVPHTGCVPHLWFENVMLIFVSRLSVHTRDLLANPVLSAMLVEDEQGSVQPFARTRLRLHCEARVVEPSDSGYEPRLDAFESRHGNTVKLLRQLPDFVLFELVPKDVIFVMGFGQAYRVSGPEFDQFEHIRVA